METFIVFLRGINVSGKNSIKMAQLKEEASALKYLHFTSYIQSGNLVFQTNDAKQVIQQKIKKLLADKFKIDTVVFTISLHQLEQLIELNPYIGKEAIEPKKLMVSFTNTLPEDEKLQQLLALGIKQEHLAFSNNVFFGYYPNGYGKAKLNNNYIEKKLNVALTTRNWNTLLRMIELGKTISL